MNSFGHYLEKYALFPEFIDELPHPELFISIVIPCSDEPDLIRTLNSLWNCTRTKSAVEVIVVINADEKAEISVKEQNQTSYKDFINWNKDHQDEYLRFYCIIENSFPSKDAGVGLARKIGMDEAIRRFNKINRSDGIIVGFDADCTCSENYLVEIEKHFILNPKNNACSIRYEHPIEGNEFTSFIYQAIIQYELYLRYYILALKQTRHPFAFHTIGSAFAVRAGIYCKQGGMNKRKAGEDFYFLHKVIPLGNYHELNTAFVYPSPRTSKRVPFGTGAAILKMENKHDYIYYTYSLNAFEDISYLFQNVHLFFSWNNIQLDEFLRNIKDPLNEFLIRDEFIKNIHEIKQNAKTLETFIPRFFRWFNAFKVLKYMNYSHENKYLMRPVTEVAMALIKKNDFTIDNPSPEDLLKLYRKI